MTRPPRAAERLLRRRLPEPIQPYLLADLEERFETFARTSATRARLWYWRQTMLAMVSPLPGAVGVQDRDGWSGAVRDVRHGLRALRRRPGHALAAVVTLGLGIGVVGTAFSILWGTVLRGLPFEEADRLVHFERASPAADQLSLAVTPHDWAAWRAEQRSFEDLGAYVEATAVFANEAAPPDRHVGVAISASSFGLLRVAPMLGRAFTSEDDVSGAPPVILLSHRLWSNRYGADSAVVGRDVLVDGAPTTVVGVMPSGFGFPIAEEFWRPLRIDMAALPRGGGRLDVFGRLRPEADVESARTEFAGIAAALEAAFPETNLGIVAALSTFEEEYIGEEFTQTVYRLLAGALLVLLVCCSNVANLLLIRGVRRRRALAVRLALGASRGRLLRQLVAEASAIAGVGAVVGVGLAAYGVAWFERVGTRAGVFALPHGSDSLFWWDVSLDGPTLILILAVTGASALLAGLAPALKAVRDASALAGSRSAVDAAGSRRLMAWMVVSQVALCCGLLVAAGLVTQSVRNVAMFGAALDGADALVSGVDLPTAYPGHEERLGFTDRLLAELESRSAISTAAVATYAPTRRPHTAPFTLESGVPPTGPAPEVGVVAVSPGYFEVFGVRASAGRTLEAGDRDGATPVALVNEAFAQRYLAGRTPVGARLRLGEHGPEEPWMEIVGVVPTLWEAPGAPEREAGLYLPVAQTSAFDRSLRLGRWGLGYPVVAARARGDRTAGVEALREAVFAVDGSLPLRQVRSMEDLVLQSTGRYRVWGGFYLTFAAAALLLAALGIYGVLSFGVTLRTPEIGVRRALGASDASVRAEVFLGAARRIGLGLVIGLALGIALVDGISTVLYGVDVYDWRVYSAVVGVLTAVGVAASWLPARRAARIEPVIAIRAD